MHSIYLYTDIYQGLKCFCKQLYTYIYTHKKTRDKKFRILCARSMSRSREQSTKRKSSSENMRKVSVYSTLKITRLYDYIKLDTFVLKKLTRCAKVCGLFFLIVFLGCWLAGEANSDHVTATWTRGRTKRIQLLQKIIGLSAKNRKIVLEGQ